MSEKQFYPRATKENPKLKRMQVMNLAQSKIIENPKQQQVNEKSQHSSSGQGQSHQKQKQSTCCQKQKVKDYLYSWVFFVIAFVVYLLIWVIGHFSVQRLTAYYYFASYNVSPYTSLEFWKMSSAVTNATGEKYFLSNELYLADDLRRADAIALSLFFSWVMWKLPLTVFTLKVIRHKNHSLQRYSTYGFFLILLLLIDIMVTIFKPQGYQEWIFFVIYLVLSIVLIVVNGLRAKRKLLKNFKNFILPIIYIVLAYVSFSLLIPGIYGAIYKSLSSDAAYIIVYIFPVIDLIFYSLIIMITYICDSHVIKFIKMFQFLNTGYAVGHMILFSPEDVEFYYLVGYFVVRNLSFNWIYQRVQKYVIVPCSQPGWLMVYLVSLSINFIPFVGFGKLVVSKSFYSQILQLTLPIQSYMLPKDYYAYEQSSLPQFSTFNPGLKSNIQISTIFIIWVLMTITQKYHISRVEFKEVFFYIFGIYMFYFGLATGSQLYYLQANSI